MSESKEKLRQIINGLPFDRIERDIMEKSLQALSDKDAENIIENLSSALAALPDALNRLEKALAQYESRQQGGKNGKAG